VRDVDAKARDPAVEPEAQDVVERCADLLVPPVQVGLLGQEVVQVHLPGGLVELPGRAAEHAAPVVRRLAAGAWVAPDVPVAPRRLARGAGLGEPSVLVAGVVGDEVEQHLHPALARARDQRVEIVDRPQLGVHAAVVADVEAPVGVRRRERRVQPQAVDAQPGEVIQALGDPAEVAHSVAGRVGERARVALVEDAVAPPHPVAGGPHADCVSP
jgi:hypothetical protein